MSSFVDYSIGWSSNVLGNRPIFFFPRGTLTTKKNWKKWERERERERVIASFHLHPLRFLPVCLLLLFWKRSCFAFSCAPLFLPSDLLSSLRFIFPLFPEFLQSVVRWTCTRDTSRGLILNWEMRWEMFTWRNTLWNFARDRSTFKSEFFTFSLFGCFADYRGQECTYIFCCSKFWRWINNFTENIYVLLNWNSSCNIWYYYLILFWKYDILCIYRRMFLSLFDNYQRQKCTYCHQKFWR